MSVFKKLKDVLFDIEEEEIPVITKEEKVKKVEPVKEENPIKEVKMPKDSDVSSTKSNFNFPLDFDLDERPKTRETRTRSDYDIDDYKPRRSSYEAPKKDERRMDYSKFLQDDYGNKKKDNSKPFKPTPIISPVYGILDQNYTKDDVIVKTDSGVKSPDLEEVRKKAYGVSKKQSKSIKIEIEEDEFAEPLKSLEEILVDNEKEEELITVKDIEERVNNKKLEDTTEIIVEKDKKNVDIFEDDIKEDTLENDLFNLIDSMYEERNESEEEE